MLNDTAKANELSHKIKLLVNPEEDEGKKIITLVDSLRVSVGDLNTPPKRQEITEFSDAMILVTQQYLKKEWERVKNLS